MSETTVSSLSDDAGVVWLLICGVLVFFMQAGFALLECGTIAAKNTKNILLKNLMDACMGGIIWWAFGWSFAYGAPPEKSNTFIGGYQFFSSNHGGLEGGTAGYFVNWFFQWAFAATAATIVSGAVAERCQFKAYLGYTVAITGFVYPVVVYWGWSGAGWLTDATKLGGNGYKDFAGSGIVHMVGGGAGLVGAIFLGPRKGRFIEGDGEQPTPQHHNVAVSCLGALILWFGWYGFNCGSTLGVAGLMNQAALVAMNTTLAACTGGAGVLLLHVFVAGNKPDVPPVLNGILAGLVSITAPCAWVEPYGAFLIGAIGAVVYFYSSKLLVRLRIDDPLDASPVHFFCGIWGVLSVGLFASHITADLDPVGAFYGGKGAQFAAQLAGVVSITAWTFATSGLVFFVLKKTNSLRVTDEEEEIGLDAAKHNGSAYNYEPTLNAGRNVELANGNGNGHSDISPAAVPAANL